jgi:aspartyl-tRNA(Asn)/glutamyl-tRNA(Gln) amidotransferase subunit C
MAISRQDVLHVAQLARLELGDDEVERMIRDLGGILDYVAQLGELDTSQVPATAQIAVEGAPLRADEPARGLSADEALAEAPRTSDGSFAVPAFVDES